MGETWQKSESGCASPVNCLGCDIRSVCGHSLYKITAFTEKSGILNLMGAAFPTSLLSAHESDE